jgi:hypothetical protein
MKISSYARSFAGDDRTAIEVDHHMRCGRRASAVAEQERRAPPKPGVEQPVDRATHRVAIDQPDRPLHFIEVPPHHVHV